MNLIFDQKPKKNYFVFSNNFICRFAAMKRRKGWVSFFMPKGTFFDGIIFFRRNLFALDSLRAIKNWNKQWMRKGEANKSMNDEYADDAFIFNLPIHNSNHKQWMRRLQTIAKFDCEMKRVWGRQRILCGKTNLIFFRIEQTDFLSVNLILVCSQTSHFVLLKTHSNTTVRHTRSRTVQRKSLASRTCSWAKRLFVDFLGRIWFGRLSTLFRSNNEFDIQSLWVCVIVSFRFKKQSVSILSNLQCLNILNTIIFSVFISVRHHQVAIHFWSLATRDNFPSQKDYPVRRKEWAKLIREHKSTLLAMWNSMVVWIQNKGTSCYLNRRV